MRRAFLGAFDSAALLAMAACLWAGLSRPALAYVDPSVMTYTIQALAGVAVALSAVIGVAWRRLRRVVLRVLKVDENAGKTVEPRVSRIAPEESAAADKHISSTLLVELNRRSGNHAAGKPEDELKWRSRFLTSMAVSGCLVFSLFFIAPFELVAGNQASLVLGISDVWTLFVVPSLILFVVASVLVSALRGRAFNVAIQLLFGFALASFIQSLVLNSGLPTADGTAIDWTQLTKKAVIFTCIWAAIVFLPLIFASYLKRAARYVAIAGSLLLILVQSVSAGAMYVSAGQSTDSTQNVLTEDGMLTVSSSNNVIVFVLDQYDTVIDLMPAIQDDPSLLNEMDGFTWFQNASAVITPTREAIPYMLTSKELPHEHTNGESIADEPDNGTDYLSMVKNAGYSVGVYDDLVNPDASYLNGIADNDVSRGSIDLLHNVDRGNLYKTLLSCGLLRDLPWAFKPFFWFYTDDINQAMTKTVDDAAYDPSDTVYSTDDAGFAEKLHSYGLTVDGNEGNGAFRFIHLNGAHDPYVMNEDEGRDSDASREQQAIGAMNIVSDYIKQLKSLGLYDDATIIITADHGRHSYYNTGNLSDPYAALDETSVPIILAKLPGSMGSPCNVSTMPVSTDDVMPTVASVIPGATVSGGDTSLFAVDDENRVRYFYQLSKDENGEHGVVEYRIVGNANDLANWAKTGWVRRYPQSDWYYESE